MTQTDTPDIRYWKDRGWLQKGSKYYMPYRAGFFRRGAAWILSSLVSAVFK